MLDTPATENYHARKNKLAQQMQSVSAGTVRLDKDTSNLFRDRSETVATKLSVRDFNHVIEVDQEKQIVATEGMITYGDLVDATLEKNCMPTVVPQLKSITIGGAIAGVGIESTSFRFGLPHETVLEADVLLADGSVITCNPDNEHSDLFFGLPNSYGTLGYILGLVVRTIPVKEFVQLEHHHFPEATRFFNTIEELRNSEFDFLDGSVFGPGECYLTTGKFVDSAPYTNDYTYLNIYYKSIQARQLDYLTAKDYIWRWDTDWFWCSKNLYVQNGLMRRIVGKKRLNSTSYTKVMRWNSKRGFTRRLNQLTRHGTESVIQDIDIPIENAPEFLEFLIREVNVLPIWICPIGTSELSSKFPLFPLRTDTMYINFGFWDSVRYKGKREEGFLLRKIEQKTVELGGIKSLYSDTYFEEDEFWKQYNREQYNNLKQRYDPKGVFLNIYDKCVLRK